MFVSRTKNSTGYGKAKFKVEVNCLILRPPSLARFPKGNYVRATCGYLVSVGNLIKAGTTNRRRGGKVIILFSRLDYIKIAPQGPPTAT